jgi:DNA polymerase-3 subunit beta
MSDLDLTIPRQDLASMLARASGSFSKKSPMEVLKCVLLDAADDCLAISATDTYLSAHTVSAANVKSPGRTCVDASKLNEIVRSLPAGDVRLVEKKGSLEIIVKKSKFKLATTYPDNFPPIPLTLGAERLTTMPADELARLVTQGALAISTDDAREHMKVALLELADGRATMVSTDGSRLALATTKATHLAATRLPIPASGVSELRKLCEVNKGGEVTLYRQGGYLLMTSGNATIGVRLGDDQFPPYKKVVPTSFKHSVTLARELLMDAVKRCGIVANGGTKAAGIRLEFKEGDLSIFAERESDAAHEQIDCAPGFELQIGVGASFVVQALAVLPSDEVTLEMTDPLGPIVITMPGCDESKQVCMPMRLG